MFKKIERTTVNYKNVGNLPILSVEGEVCRIYDSDGIEFLIEKEDVKPLFFALADALEIKHCAMCSVQSESCPGLEVCP